MSESPLRLAIVPANVRQARWPEPDSAWQALKVAVLDAVSSPYTRRSYEAGINSLIGWLRTESWPDFHLITVQRYCSSLEHSGLSPSSINVYLSAIRKLARKAAENGSLDREIASAIIRIPGIRQHRVQTRNCLTPEEASALLGLPDRSSLKGLRDRAILGLLVACALRRSELARLRHEHVVLREARWVLIDLVGRGKRVRTVPLPAWVKALIDDWTTVAGITEGAVFRAVNKGGRVWGEQITDDVIWSITREYGARIRKPTLAPHDLRRTCAKFCRAAGAALEQIQLLLGHSSVDTTEKYLGKRQSLVQAVNDHLPIEVCLDSTVQPDREAPVKRKPVRSEPRARLLAAAAPDGPLSNKVERT